MLLKWVALSAIGISEPQRGEAPLGVRAGMRPPENFGKYNVDVGVHCTLVHFEGLSICTIHNLRNTCILNILF